MDSALRLLQWYDGVPCSAKYASCMYLGDDGAHECLRRTEGCAWGTIRCPSGRVIVVDDREEYVDCWFYMTSRVDDIPDGVIDDGMDMMGQDVDSITVPAFVMDVLQEAFSLRRSRRILTSHIQVDRALRGSAVGHLVWMDNDAVSHYRITDTDEWVIGDAVVRTTKPFHSVFQFEVIAKLRPVA